MPLASSGTLSINDIAGEFGGSSNPESLSEFYRGGSRVPNSSANSSIPTSGTIAISNFYNGSSASDIITGTVFQTAYGAGKNVSFIGGIRPTNTNWGYNGTGFSQFTTTGTPTGGSFSDNYAESSGVTIESHTTQGNFIVSNTTLTSNNLSALVGKTASCTFTGIAFNASTATTQTLTGTQSGEYFPFALAGIANNNVVSSFNLLNCTSGTSYTQSWT